jgi:hypothetical protein
MGGDLVLGLITTSVWVVGFLFRPCASCVMQKSGFCFQESCAHDNGFPFKASTVYNM